MKWRQSKKKHQSASSVSNPSSLGFPSAPDLAPIAQPPVPQHDIPRTFTKQILIDILENLSQPEFEKFKFYMPSHVTKQQRSKGIVETATFMTEEWPGEKCLEVVKNLLKEIRRNDLLEKLNQII